MQHHEPAAGSRLPHVQLALAKLLVVAAQSRNRRRGRRRTGRGLGPGERTPHGRAPRVIVRGQPLDRAAGRQDLLDGVEEGLRLANDSAFGLQGALFTSNLKAAFRFADDFEVGCLWVNEPSRFRVDVYPFGGVKNSGVGREGIRYAVEEMSQLKFVGIRP